ncbi:MAG: glutamine synthetase beta-grasp domain-containing protein [Pseudomonadota bacterium]
MNTLSFVEYVWIDGAQPTQQVRSKARLLDLPADFDLGDFPNWSFDGSSTNQAVGDSSDCILKPIRVYDDPLRTPNDVIVLCEVLNPDGSPHASNQRAVLQDAIRRAGGDLQPWLGFEQEYTLFRSGRPLGFPVNGYPEPQGPYYCGAGSSVVYGRKIAEAHARACLDAGVLIYGINAEVMPGQWEFQVGFRGVPDEPCDALTVADDVWLARYLLHRVGEDFDVDVSFDNKPVKGDWNGAGMHTNFSTSRTRNPETGMVAIQQIIDALEACHEEHIANYGDRLAERLTGNHETCDINTFRSGVAHRGASIRIPQSVAIDGYGYLEDRRPGANADPYRVAKGLVSAVRSIPAATAGTRAA